ncbi:hypothetical protein BTBSAS_300011 [Brochothrix thermosphacta]|uniref:Uncharacterized protein n=1 Tax=Brochothrix thermosphacta TaxID=2756 RepID=A0A2X0S3H6_BROTH|nr:hypothetical protein BTBSAS_300011 [Brochothrix thermosphacta]
MTAYCIMGIVKTKNYSPFYAFFIFLIVRQFRRWSFIVSKDT